MLRHGNSYAAAYDDTGEVLVHVHHAYVLVDLLHGNTVVTRSTEAYCDVVYTLFQIFSWSLLIDLLVHVLWWW